MKAIFAVNAIDGFGTGNDLPWPKSSRDLKRFKEITSGKTVIMGKNTWESNMPNPLPNRKNIVVSKTLSDDRCTIYKSTSELLQNVTDDNLFVIGGATLLWELQSQIDTIYLTKFYSDEECEVKLDTSKYLTEFELVSGEIYFDHKFEIWKRIV